MTPNKGGTRQNDKQSHAHCIFTAHAVPAKIVGVVRRTAVPLADDAECARIAGQYGFLTGYNSA